jgi:hypothetical protein
MVEGSVKGLLDAERESQSIIDQALKDKYPTFFRDALST